MVWATGASCLAATSLSDGLRRSSHESSATVGGVFVVHEGVLLLLGGVLFVPLSVISITYYVDTRVFGGFLPGKMGARALDSGMMRVLLQITRRPRCVWQTRWRGQMALCLSFQMRVEVRSGGTLSSAHDHLEFSRTPPWFVVKSNLNPPPFFDRRLGGFTSR